MLLNELQKQFQRGQAQEETIRLLQERLAAVEARILSRAAEPRPLAFAELAGRAESPIAVAERVYTPLI